jgi:CDP-6-deoxy-D-xylo-4-hexulose-3-dehydrase
MQAALGCSQLLKLNNFINIRNKNYSFLHHSLTPIQNKVLLPQVIEGATPSWFGFPITVTDPKYSKKNVVNYLNNNGIGTRELFGGNLTRQPLYKNVPYRKIGNLENSDYIMSHSFWVGVYPGLDENKMKYLSHHLLEAFK